MNEKFSYLQILFITAVTPIGAVLFLFPYFSVRFSANAFWLSALIAALAGAVLIFVYLLSARKCSGEPFVYIRSHLGGGAAWIFFVSFVIFYLLSASSCVRVFSYIADKYLMHSSPRVLTYAVLCIAGAYFSASGLRNNARLCVVAGSISFLVLIIIFTFMCFDGDKRNFYPICETNGLPSILAFAALLFCIFPSGTQMMLINTKMKTSAVILLSLFSCYIILRVLVLAGSSAVSILGPEGTASSLDSLLSALRSFSKEKVTFFGKADILFIFFLVLLFLCSLANLFAAPVRLITQMFKSLYPPAVSAGLGILVFALSFVGGIYIKAAVALAAALPAAFVFPLIILFSRRNKVEKSS